VGWKVGKRVGEVVGLVVGLVVGFLVVGLVVGVLVVGFLVGFAVGRAEPVTHTQTRRAVDAQKLADPLFHPEPVLVATPVVPTVKNPPVLVQ
jgi:hypothetical protein